MALTTYQERINADKLLMDDSPQAVTLKCLRDLIRDGIEDAKLAETLIKINKNLNDIPLSDDEVKKIIFKELKLIGQTNFIHAAPIKLELEEGVLRFEKSSPRRQFLFDFDVIPMNTVSVIAGLGGGGKTQAVINLMSASATGQSFANRPSSPTCSLLLGFEDSREEINARFSAVIENYSENQRAQVGKNIRAISLIGADFQLVESKNRIPVSSGYADLLIAKMLELKSLTKLERGMIVIDHARLIAMIDWNDAAQVTVLTRELHRIASEAEVAVVLIAHSPKSAGSANHEISQADVAGSSALVDNARYVAIVKGMTAEEAKPLGISNEGRNNYVNFECVKSNYSAKGRIGWFKKIYSQNHHVAIHEFVEINKPITSRIGESSEESKLLKYIKTHPDLTPSDLRVRSGKNSELGLSDQVVRSTTIDLIEKGMLVYIVPSNSYIKKKTPNFKGVLAVANGV